MEKKSCSRWESNPGPFIYYILNPNSPKTKYLKKINLFFNVNFWGIRVQQGPGFESQWVQHYFFMSQYLLIFPTVPCIDFHNHEYLRCELVYHSWNIKVSLFVDDKASLVHVLKCRNRNILGNGMTNQGWSEHSKIDISYCRITKILKNA